MIACRTTIGFGAPNKGGTEKSHGSALGSAAEHGAQDQALDFGLARILDGVGLLIAGRTRA